MLVRPGSQVEKGQVLVSVAMPELAELMAAIGGVVALYGRGIPFSVSAAIGFIALSGIAVLNGQVLIAAIRNQLAEGLAVQQAVIVAAKQRLVPVLATAITDAVGFLPMALSLGVGAACVTVRPAFLLRMARLVLLTIYRMILTV